MAPAMRRPDVPECGGRKNIAFLKEQGVRFVDPDTGPCLWYGQGRLAEIEKSCNRLVGITRKRSGRLDVLVTAGPTREQIDAVRFISNLPRARWDAIAEAARDRERRLFSYPAHRNRTPAGVTVILYTPAMYKTVMDMWKAPRCDHGCSGVRF
jgi:phosphopantothenoylcysteine decarboxylase/phosphopantothenate--cysteine ligase